MEMKKIYMAPEVEILCFRPAESLANLLTSTWGWTGGSGGLGGDEEDNPGFEVPSINDEYEDPDGEG